MSETKLYAIEIKEGWFGGLHGVVDYLVIEGTYNDAQNLAENRSIELMEEYNIADEAGWEQDALDEGLEEDSYDFCDFLYNCMLENIDYEIWEVIPNTRSLEELNDLIQKDSDDFIKNFCKEPELPY